MMKIIMKIMKKIFKPIQVEIEIDEEDFSSLSDEEKYLRDIVG